jgi:microcystin-dependent protein
MRPFAGQLAVFPYGYAPSGWLECLGQYVPIAKYPGLYAVIGNTYGIIDQQYFGLPDLQGRAPVGLGTLPGGDTYALAKPGGAEAVTLLSNNMPAHTHDLCASTGDGTTNDPSNAVLASVAGDSPKGRALGNIYSPNYPDSAMITLAAAPAGSQQPHTNMQPSLALRFCINYDGPPPPRP